MTQRPSRDGRPRRRPAPAPPSGTGEVAEEALSLRGLPSLERLREHVEQAARELERLRADNQALLERVQALEADAGTELVPALDLGEDPEALRRKITGFIESIDQYLKQERPT